MRLIISLLIILLFPLLSFAGQGMYPIPMVYVASGTSCTQAITQTTDDSDFAFSSTSGQILDIDSSTTICKFVAELASEYGNTLTFKIQIWSDINATGTQYGGDSAIVTIDSAISAVKSFEWTSDYPAVTGDVYAHLINVSGVAGELLIRRSNYDGYAGDNYTTFEGGVKHATRDMVFELWTK